MARFKFRTSNRKVKQRPRNGEGRKAKIPKGLQWLPVPFKKHKGKTLPQILFEDPSYVFWLVGQGYVYGRLLHQLNFVVERARHILPPREIPDEYQFGVEYNGEGWLERIRILEKSRGAANLIVTPHLDLSLFCLFRLDEMREKDALLHWLRAEFFDCEGLISKVACEAFLNDDSNFGLTCRRMHGFPDRAISAMFG